MLATSIEQEAQELLTRLKPSILNSYIVKDIGFLRWCDVLEIAAEGEDLPKFLHGFPIPTSTTWWEGDMQSAIREIHSAIQCV